MATARIDRMVRELQSEPSFQFFQRLFGLVGLGPSARPGRRSIKVDPVVGRRFTQARIA